MRAGLDRAGHVHFVGVHTQDKDAYAWKSSHDLLDRIDTAQLRHREVEDDHIRFQFQRLPYRLPTVGSLADHLPAGLRLENLPEALTDQRVIVGQKNADGRHLTPSQRAAARL